MKKRVAFMLVFLFTTSLFLVFPPRVFSQTVNLNVLSYSWYTSPYSGNFIVVGELQNIGSDTLGSARVNGIVYTKDGQAQASPYATLVYGSNLMPNQTAPFYMQFSAKTSNWGNLSWVSLGIDRVDFYFYGSASEEEPYSGLQLVANESYVDSTGNYSITGVVLNRGDGYPENVWAVASYYNASGTVIAVGFSNYILPHYTPAPNQTAFFTLIPTDPTPEMATQITSFSVQILSSGTTTAPTPEPSFSPSPSLSASPSASSSASSSPSATASSSPGTSASPESGVYLSMNTIYTIIAVVIVVVAIIAVVFLLRKRTKASAPK